tara:strand:+ start:211 stop:894 length:684 start_codon:yes stop_codon:yes gene_type:complete
MDSDKAVTLVTVGSALCLSKHDIAEPSGDFFDMAPRLFYAFGYCSEAPRDVAATSDGTSPCRLVFTNASADFAMLRPFNYQRAECFLLGYNVNDAAGFKDEVTYYIEEVTEYHRKGGNRCPPIVLLAIGERLEGCVSPEAVASVVGAGGGVVDGPVNFAWTFPPFNRSPGVTLNEGYLASNTACAAAMRPALDAVLAHCHGRGVAFRAEQEAEQKAKKRKHKKCVLQ